MVSKIPVRCAETRWKKCPKDGRSAYEGIRRWRFVPVRPLRFCLFDMDIDLIFKIAAIGIIVSILNQVLSRSGREEQATLTTLAGVIVVLMMVAREIADLFDLVKRLFGF